MIARFLILACMMLFLLNSPAQMLQTSGSTKYATTVHTRKHGPYKFTLWVYDGERMDMALHEIDPITGNLSGRSFSGSATNRPNGLIIGKFPGRGTFRARVNADGTMARGRLRMLTKDGHHVWFSKRVEVTPIPEPTYSPYDFGNFGFRMVFIINPWNPPVIFSPDIPLNVRVRTNAP